MENDPDPAYRLPAIAAALAIACLSAPASAGPRVLPPEAGPRIVEALRAAAPSLVLASVRIDKDVVWANLCPPDDARHCVAVELTDPESPCPGAVAGPFCLGFPAVAPGPEARASLTRAFAALADPPIWKEIPAPPPAPPRGSAHPRTLALALLAVPLAAGFFLARALRLVARSRRWLHVLTTLTIAIAALAAGPLLVPAIPSVGAWDLVLAGMLVALGALAGASALGGRALGARLGVAATGTLLAISLMEIVARALPAPPATFPPPEEARLVFEAEPGAEACAPLYPDALPAAFAERTAHMRPDHLRILHLGDSMVEGAGVSPGETFVAELGRQTPEIDQINAGFSSTSTDFQLLVARAWTPRTTPSRVILYVFGYNDLAELDRRYPCCPDGPLLDLAAAARCASPGRATGRRALFASSPAPYPIRVATSASALARRAAVAFAAVGTRLHARERGPDLAAEDRFARFASLLAAMKRDLAAQGVPLAVAYLPARAALESGAPRETGDYRLRGDVGAVAASLDLPFLDPWDELESAVKREGIARIYLPPPDIHFTPEGHRIMAAWLRPRLGP